MQFAAPLVLVGFLVVMWLSFRAQARRRGELAHMQATLEVGDEVMLTSGVYGVLREINDEDTTVRLEVADGVVIRVARGAIGELVLPDESEPTGETAADPARDSDVSKEN